MEMKFRFFFASNKGEKGYIPRGEARRMLGVGRYNALLRDARKIFALNPEDDYYTLVRGGILVIELDNQSKEDKK